VSNAGTGISTPTQQDRVVYSVVWPYIEIDDGSVLGDIDALTRLEIQSVSDDDGPGGANPATYFDKVIIGTRKVSRGAGFTPCFIMSQEQNPSGITVAVGPNGVFTADIDATPTGEMMRVTPAGPDSYIADGSVTIDPTLSKQYNGRFRTFIRCWFAGATPSANVTMGLQVVTGTGGVTQTESSKIAVTGGAATTGPHLIETGIIDIKTDKNIPNTIVISPLIATDAVIAIDLIDIWLIPVDEWSAEIRDPARTSTSRTYYPRKLIVDNIRNPKESISWVSGASGLSIAKYLDISSADPIIAPADQTRMYFLFSYWLSPNTFSPYYGGARVKMSTVPRYLGMRGDR